MANDLSQIEQRTSGQKRDRLGDRRSSIIPERRNTRAPELSPSGSMRTAARGDGGAEALMRTLGLVQGATKDLEGYINKDFEKKEERQAAQGALDAATGRYDDAAAKKSFAYRDSVARGRTATAWNAHAREMEDAASEFLEGQQDATLEERQANYDAFLENQFTSFATDPDTGALREYLSTPGALRYAAEEVQKARVNASIKGRQRIEERFVEEALSNAAQNIRDQSLTGHIDLNFTLGLIPKSVPDAAKRATILATSQELLADFEQRGDELGGRVMIDALLAGGFDVDGTDQSLDEAALGTIRPVDLPPSTARNDNLPAPAAASTAPAYSRAAYKTAVKGPESNNNPNAVNGMGSSASGIFQFTEGTFKGYYKRVFGATSSQARDAWANKRFDAATQDKLMDALIADNERALTGLGLPINNGNMYIMHVLGAGDGPRFLKANPNTPVDQLLSATIVKQNPSYFGGGKTVAQAASKMASVVGGSADGVAGPSGIPANPEYRSPVEKLSPLEQYLKAPPVSTAKAVMVGGLALTQTERNHLLQVREQFTERAITKWHKEEKERMGRNASTLTMGILGQGAPVSFETITSMAASGEIDEDDAARLVTVLESRSDRVVAEAERQEAARSREEQRANDDLVESQVSRLILPALTGKKTPEQVRADALTIAARLARTHPLEAAKIISGANSALGGIEGTREGTTGYRDVITEFDKNDRDYFAGRALRQQGIPNRRKEEFVKFTDDLVTRGAQRLQRELLNGADPVKSAEAVRLWITQQMNLKVGKLAVPAKQ